MWNKGNTAQAYCTLRSVSDRCRCGIVGRGPALSRSLLQTLLFQVILFDPFRSPYIAMLWRHLVGRERNFELATKLCETLFLPQLSAGFTLWVLHMDQKLSIADMRRVNFRLFWTSMWAWTNISLNQIREDMDEREGKDYANDIYFWTRKWLL